MQIRFGFQKMILTFLQVIKSALRVDDHFDSSMILRDNCNYKGNENENPKNLMLIFYCIIDAFTKAFLMQRRACIIYVN